MEYEKYTAQKNADAPLEVSQNAEVGSRPEDGQSTLLTTPGEQKTDGDVFDNDHGNQTQNEKAVGFEGESGKEMPKQTQSSSLNAEFARRRREEKRLAELKYARESAVIEALGGVNPFTGNEMHDSADVEEFLTMRKLKNEGRDPLSDFLSYRKEEARKTAERDEREEWFRNDAEEFFSSHPDVDIVAISKDSGFLSFAKGKIGNYPLSEIYDEYTVLSEQMRERAGKIAAQSLANMRATPGSLTTSEKSDDGFFTPEMVDRMSQEEVLHNYDKIRESMKKWRY